MIKALQSSKALASLDQQNITTLHSGKNRGVQKTKIKIFEKFM